MAGSISNYSLSLTTKTTTNTFVSNKKIFADGEIMLNGKRVSIGGSLESAARKINQISKFTGIKAEIKTKDNKARLVLVTLGNNVNINDPKKLLLNLYKSGKINNTDNSFIQIKNKNSRTVKINYAIGAASSMSKNMLKNAFNNSAGNIEYIKGAVVVVNPINALNEIEAFHDDDGEQVLTPNIRDDINFDPSVSATDILWGIASIAYNVAKDTISYGYNTANTYLFGEDK